MSYPGHTDSRSEIGRTERVAAVLATASLGAGADREIVSMASCAQSVAKMGMAYKLTPANQARGHTNALSYLPGLVARSHEKQLGR